MRLDNETDEQFAKRRDSDARLYASELARTLVRLEAANKALAAEREASAAWSAQVNECMARLVRDMNDPSINQEMDATERLFRRRVK